MKIGVLTYHRSINCGAFTQCYALVTELQKRFPQDQIEVIDYVPEFRVKVYDPSIKNYLLESFKFNRSFILKIKSFVKRIGHVVVYNEQHRLIKKRYKAFNESMRFLPLSSKKCISDDYEDFVKMYSNDYDVIVVGSDCVWEWSTVPFPNAYYLCGDFACKKVTYAASLGTDSVSTVTKYQRQHMLEAIKQFSYIGVRDTSTEYVLRELSKDIQVYHNCDPTTFLNPKILESHRIKVAEHLRKLGISNDKLIVGVMGDKEILNIAKNSFGNDAYYVSLYLPHKNVDANLIDISVLEWASVFGLFDITFTSYFHGTMLSLVNGTPVISVDRLPENEKQITKLHELYNRLDLDGFYWRKQGKFSTQTLESIKKTANRLVTIQLKDKILQEVKKESKSCESFFDYLNCLKRDMEVNK